MADYSSTPLWRKLGIKPGTALRLVGAPHGFRVAGLPNGVVNSRGRADVIVVFARERDALAGHFPDLVAALPGDGGLWVAWPKKTAGLGGDLDFATVQDIGLGAGLVDNKSCAIDDQWQALRFVYRLRDRQQRYPGT